MMESGKHSERIKFYKANDWRAYKISDHESEKLKGKDLVEIYFVSLKCYEYYKKANDMLFSGGKVNPKIMRLSSERIGQLIDRFQSNLSTVCSKTKLKDDFKKTVNSTFFNENLYPFLYTQYKADISALRYIQALKRDQEASAEIN